MRNLHLLWQECALCHGTAYTEGRLSLHHIHKHPRDDVKANLVMLCGDGVRGCHGKIEASDPETKLRLGEHINRHRRDTLVYLTEKFGGVEAGGVDAMVEWLQRHGYLH